MRGPVPSCKATSCATNGQPLPRVKHWPQAVRQRLSWKQHLLIYGCLLLLAWAMGLICAGLLELVG